MAIFFQMIKFEYDKILSKKSVKIAILISILTIIVVTAFVIFTNYGGFSELNESRELERSINGRDIDERLLMEAAKAYQTFPEDINPESKRYFEVNAKYGASFEFARAILRNDSSRYSWREFANTSHQTFSEIYDTRQDKIDGQINHLKISNPIKTQLKEESLEVKTPFKYNYHVGYDRFFKLTFFVMMIILFLVSMCVAPLFAGEYTSGMDQLILSSKNGKQKLILAKLLTGITLSIVITVVGMLILYLTSSLIYGMDSADVPFQLFLGQTIYALTMKEAVQMIVITSTAGAIFYTSIAMFFSSKLKSSFSVMVILAIIIVLPIVITSSTSYPILYNSLRLLPLNASNPSLIFSTLPYQMLGYMIKPYVFLPILSLVLSIILLPFTYCIFKRHQVS